MLPYNAATSARTPRAPPIPATNPAAAPDDVAGAGALELPEDGTLVVEDGTLVVEDGTLVVEDGTLVVTAVTLVVLVNTCVAVELGADVVPFREAKY